MIAEIADMTTTETRPRMSQRLRGSTSAVLTRGTVRSASSQSLGPVRVLVAVVMTSPLAALSTVRPEPVEGLAALILAAGGRL